LDDELQYFLLKSVCFFVKCIHLQTTLWFAYNDISFIFLPVSVKMCFNYSNQGIAFWQNAQGKGAPLSRNTQEAGAEAA